MARLGVDIDGVLADWSGAFARRLNRKYGLGLPVDAPDFPRAWDWRLAYGIPEGVWAETVRDLDEEFWFGEVQPFSRLDMEALAEAEQEHEIYYLTARSGGARARRATQRWLQKHGIPCPTVIFTGPSKLPYLRAFALASYIDDRPETLQEVGMTALMGAPLETTLFIRNQPWNQTGVPRGVLRVPDLKTFLTVSSTVSPRSPAGSAGARRIPISPSHQVPGARGV